MILSANPFLFCQRFHCQLQNYFYTGSKFWRRYMIFFNEIGAAVHLSFFTFCYKLIPERCQYDLLRGNLLPEIRARSWPLLSTIDFRYVICLITISSWNFILVYPPSVMMHFFDVPKKFDLLHSWLCSQTFPKVSSLVLNFVF